MGGTPTIWPLPAEMAKENGELPGIDPAFPGSRKMEVLFSDGFPWSHLGYDLIDVLVHFDPFFPEFFIAECLAFLCREAFHEQVTRAEMR